MGSKRSIFTGKNCTVVWIICVAYPLGQTLVIEQSSRTLWNKTTHSLRFFLSSLKPDFPNFPTSIRSHWGIENQLHWCLYE